MKRFPKESVLALFVLVALTSSFSQPFSSEVVEDFQVNEEDYPSPFDQQFPSVSVSGTGHSVVAWWDQRHGLFYDAYYVCGQRYDSLGNPIGDNFRVSESDFSSPPSVDCDFQGNFVVAWRDGRNGRSDIYAQRYDSSGNPLGSNFRVNDDTTSVSRGLPAVSLDWEGDFAVVWRDGRNGSNDIYGQRFENGGAPVGSNFRINDDTTLAGQSRASVSTDALGNFVVVWEDGRRGHLIWDIYAQRYDSAGGAIGGNFLVNDDTVSGSHNLPAVSSDSLGDFVVTWTDGRNGHRDIYAQRYDSMGTAVGGNFVVNDDGGSCAQAASSVSLDCDGDFAVTWMDYRDTVWNIYVQRFDRGGNPLGGNFRADDDTTGAEQEYPSIALAPDGDFLLAWSDCRNGDKDIYAQRFDSSGLPLGPNFKTNTDTGGAWQATSSIAVSSDGHFVIGWTDGRNDSRALNDIYAQGYDPDANPLGRNFKVNADSIYASQCHSSIAGDAAGNFVVCWYDGRVGNDIYAQRYDSWGNPLGENFRVNNDTSGYRDYPSISMDPSGNFVIAWSDWRGDNYDIYCQRYDGNGNAVGDNFMVNDDTTGLHQSYPSISACLTGLAVTWLDWRHDVLDVYAQRYDRDGNPLGDNFKVNDDTTRAEETHPALAMGEAGDFIVCWSDARVGNHGVYCQRYDSSGNPVGSNFKVNDDTSAASGASVSLAYDGDFVITWADLRHGGDDFDIYCQAYRSDGAPIGANFRINNDGPGNLQGDPHVAMDNDKNIYFTWTDNRVPYQNLDVFAKVIAWNEIPGAEQVNSHRLRVTSCRLEQNFPNPFTHTTHIRYTLPPPNGDVATGGPSPEPSGSGLGRGTVKCLVQGGGEGSLVSDRILHITLAIYDLSGRLVRTLVDEPQEPGSYAVIWDGRDNRGDKAASGVYFCRLCVAEPALPFGPALRPEGQGRGKALRIEGSGVEVSPSTRKVVLLK